MASTSSSAQAGPSPAVAHLPDASEELGRTADLTITVQGTQLKLHSAVAAAGSRVLRTALCSCGGGDGAAVAAVQAAFEGCKLADVQLFLTLLYNPVALVAGRAGASGATSRAPGGVQPDAWRGLLGLADKLDAPGVMHACDVCIAHRLSTLPEGNGTMFGATFGERMDYMGWLQTANKLRLDNVADCCAAPVVKEVLKGSAAGAKQRMATLTQLGQPASGMLLAALAKGVLASSSDYRVAGNLPATVDHRAPENLF